MWTQTEVSGIAFCLNNALQGQRYTWDAQLQIKLFGLKA